MYFSFIEETDWTKKRANIVVIYIYRAIIEKREPLPKLFKWQYFFWLKCKVIFLKIVSSLIHASSRVNDESEFQD